jgi:hypothetical protein
LQVFFDMSGRLSTAGVVDVGHLKRLRATPAPLSRPIIKTLQVLFLI